MSWPNTHRTAQVSSMESNIQLKCTICFSVKAKTIFGESIYICGDIPELGNWDPSKAVQMTTNPSIYPEWKSPGILLSTIKRFQILHYKYLKKFSDNPSKPPLWEIGDNRFFNMRDLHFFTSLTIMDSDYMTEGVMHIIYDGHPRYDPKPKRSVYDTRKSQLGYSNIKIEKALENNILCKSCIRLWRAKKGSRVQILKSLLSNITAPFVILIDNAVRELFYMASTKKKASSEIGSKNAPRA